ncbi:class I SAM-dependent methyltransferase [Rhizobium paknamense]|uniref:Ubiquinone/menaquinone biosynthesis C-methylase UbiE n=1 Tax=Rhizobium paknamense TaxID=1206817 RepID=A0ABU0IHN8_9HYPH|nr:class I SAM-dependent methyltransferase [Rhizobium paknamense]MDQ0457177.1 ubiquinone/menaquinone biosynthesis C-methylase UbiE [Rhizobium paknamense]
MVTPTPNDKVRDHDRNVQAQFGPRAEAYVASAVHASGADLDRIAALASAASPLSALDLGCGGGHVAYALAPHSGTVTAVDLSCEMLEAVRATAAGRGYSNLRIEQASAEALPFAAETFDFLASRFTAHHWHDVDAGLRQARRVLKAGSPAVFVDVIAPGVPLLDTHLQSVELLRDTSHVRNYSLAEWTEKLTRAGFRVEACRHFRSRMEFASWTARMATPEPLVTAIRALQQAAPSPVKSHFCIEEDGSFMLDMVLIEAAA